MDCDVITGSRQACVAKYTSDLKKRSFNTISLIFGEHIRLPYLIIFVSFLHVLFVRSSDYPLRG